MIKKIFLLFMLVANVFLIQNTVFAEGQSSQDFYLDSIKKKIDRNWVIPSTAEGNSAVVSFTINSDGSVSNVKVLRSSKDDIFDHSVVKAVYKSLPLTTFAASEEPVNVQFFFSPIFLSATQVHEQNQSNIVNVANINPYINFSDYTDNLENKLSANWKPKATAKEQSAIVSINVDKDGALGNYYILKSSRNKKFDRVILDTIATSVPYDVFPDGINAPNTDIQLTFKSSCDKINDTPIYNNYVDARVMNIKGYDSYTKQAEKIVANSLKNKRCFRYKDLIAEIKINKSGKLNYVKIVKSSNDKNFDREILVTLQKTSFPPVPETIPFNDVTLNYEISTQRGATVRDFFVDYLMNYGTTGLKSFAIVKD